MERRHDEPTAAILRATPRFPIAARISISGAVAEPAVYRLAHGSCVVGAGADADILVDDPKVSRRHLELTLVPEGIAVTDLGSRNGSYYLGQRFERMILALGSRVRVGAAELLLAADEEALSPKSEEGPTEYHGLLGTSQPMRQLFARMSRLEGSLVNVLVQGESGVGKELIARGIHQASGLADKPFVTLNCGALPRELIASELFGHRRGAFTGAAEGRRGAFEHADGGTLFLDEVGELPLDVQPMLLRALESGEVRALGDDNARRVKVRVITATNRVLAEEVRAGRFREDLYFRIAVVTLTVPPLRERRGDVELLAAHFAALDGAPALPDALLADLTSRRWSGNVRELRNAVQAYLALGELPPGGVGADDGGLERALRKYVDLERAYAEQKDDLGARFTRVYLEALMRRADGNQTEAARIAGLDRGYLGRLLVKHGVRRE
jgi:transcriptional regulator with GAF, ATPase, and Fis domain